MGTSEQREAEKKNIAGVNRVLSGNVLSSVLCVCPLLVLSLLRRAPCSVYSSLNERGISCSNYVRSLEKFRDTEKYLQATFPRGGTFASSTSWRKCLKLADTMRIARKLVSMNNRSRVVVGRSLIHYAKRIVPGQRVNTCRGRDNTRGPVDS